MWQSNLSFAYTIKQQATLEIAILKSAKTEIHRHETHFHKKAKSVCQYF